MKNLKSTLFVFVASCLIFSCNTRKVAYFNNHYERYQSQNESPSKINKQSNEKTILDKIAEAEKASEPQKATSGLKTDKGLNKPIDKGIPVATPKRISKEQKKSIRKEIKELVKSKKKSDSEVATVLLIILAILLPPLAVFLVDGISGPFWLSILLTILLWIPGVIYALFRVFKHS